jgi:chaperonin GroES
MTALQTPQVAAAVATSPSLILFRSNFKGLEWVPRRTKKSSAPLLKPKIAAPSSFSPGAWSSGTFNIVVISNGGSFMKFRPLHDRVVVKRIDAEQKSAGGIIIPDTAKEKPQEGEVVAVGPGARNERGELVAIELKPGDRVLFGKWSGTEVKLEGQELLIMKESDIMGVIEPVAEIKKAA